MFRTLSKSLNFATRSNFVQKPFFTPIIKKNFYAEAEPELKFTLACPHATIVNGETIRMVTVPAASGDMGIQAEHVPTVCALYPGVVTIEDMKEKDSKYFVSGGYVFVYEDSTCVLNAIDAIPLEHLDLNKANDGLQKAEAGIASTAEETDERIEHEIAQEVFGNIKHALEEAN